MKSTALVFLAIITVLVSFSRKAEAKDMSNRLGVGFKNQFTFGLPSLAVQYYPGAELGLAAVIGVDTQQGASKFGAMLKLNKIVFSEDNLNFYMGIGAGLISYEVTPGNNQSGFQLMAYGGTEFFFAGLENLGFSFEFGPSVTSLSSQVRFQTFGDSPVRAGITFYF